jgi:MOSC domain-containing protein YiiM
MEDLRLFLHHIYISDGHRFFGRHGLGPAEHAVREVREVECVADQGLRGDRFFASAQHRDGQVTLFSREVFEQMLCGLRLDGVHPSAMRRNLLVSGADLNRLVGREFELQGVRLFGVEECRPCYWMNTAVGPGAEEWLRGRGGLRCRALSSGWLRARASELCLARTGTEG